jgi:septum formation protein
MELVLASSSPRRQELLRFLGCTFTISTPDIDESQLQGEDPLELVRRLAESKARCEQARYPDACIIGADTVVVLDGVVLGKPLDRDHAVEMLEQLSGRQHEVMTGMAVLRRDYVRVAHSVTSVQFCELTRQQCLWYVETGEPLDKAGAYAIQGVGTQFIRRISGSYSNVVGMDLAMLKEMLVNVPGAEVLL